MIKTVKYLHDTKNIKVYVNNVNQHKITNKMNVKLKCLIKIKGIIKKVNIIYTIWIPEL